MSLEKDLDRALAGQHTDEPEIDSLVALARELQHTLTVEPSSWARERQMFVAGVAGRRRGLSLTRFLAPALATAAVLLIGVVGRFAMPGETLYPVRQALQTLRLAPSVWEVIDDDIARGGHLVVAAESALAQQDLVRAEQRAGAALAELDHALVSLDGLDGNGKIERVLAITLLQDRAEEVIAAVERDEETPDPSDRGPEPGRKGDDDEEEGEDDDDDDGNSGPGGDDGNGEATDGDDGGDGDDANRGPGGNDDGETLNGDTLDGDENEVEEIDD